MDYLRLKNMGIKKRFPITKDGLDSLKKKLDAIMLERFNTIKRIRALDEEAKDDPLALADEVRRLELADAEANNINDVLTRAEPVTSPDNPTFIQIGSRVTLEMDSRQSTYIVVSSPEVDLASNKISEDSPLGTALLGRKHNETVTITTQKGKQYLYTIIDIQ